MGDRYTLMLEQRNGRNITFGIYRTWLEAMESLVDCVFNYNEDSDIIPGSPESLLSATVTRGEDKTPIATITCE